jgi:LPXTG-site transpeptidase (sortase) family protein
MNADGTITVTAGTTPGTYTYPYTICEKLNPTNCDTATATIEVNNSSIGIAKNLVSSIEVSPGIYEITYDLYVKNYGSTILNSVQVTDDLSATFPGMALTVQTPTSTKFAVNASFNGISNRNVLMNTGNSLAVGESGTVRIVVRVTPTSAGPFSNTAVASGQCPTCTTAVTDQSQNGTDPDYPDNDKDPTNNNVPTTVNFGPNLFDPPFGLKVFDASGLPLLRWTMVWINNSNIVAVNAQVTDTIPAGTTYVPGSVVCTPASANTTTTTCSYDAGTNSIIWSGNLGPDLGATDANSAANEITITFDVTVNSGVRNVQNTATIDTDLNGINGFNDPGERQVASATSRWSASSGTTTSSGLPATGFAPNVVTEIQPQPADLRYAPTDLILEIPSLGVNLPIVGVPKKSGGWDVSWLTDQAGWLEGTAFPSWNGNSVLTSHVYQSNGLPGPFVNIGKLKYGDKVIVHAYGQKYTFEVRTNAVVAPNDTSAFKHEEKSWLTLVTCKEYDQKANTYKKRILVRAVLIKVEAE